MTLPPPPEPARPLTPRQLAVARLCGSGYSHRQIAAALGISPRTVKHHVHAIGVVLSGNAPARVRVLIYGARLLERETQEARAA